MGIDERRKPLSPRGKGKTELVGSRAVTYLARSGGRDCRLEVLQDMAGFRVRLDDREFPVDFLQVDPGLYSLLIDSRSYEVDLLELEDAMMVLVNGQPFRVEIQDERARRLQAAGGTGHAKAGKRLITAPMPGKVVRLLVRLGDPVQAGDGIVVVEAMKMENELKAPTAGTVTEIRVQEGRAVGGGEVLVVVE